MCQPTSYAYYSMKSIAWARKNLWRYFKYLLWISQPPNFGVYVCWHGGKASFRSSIFLNVYWSGFTSSNIIYKYTRTRIRVFCISCNEDIETFYLISWIPDVFLMYSVCTIILKFNRNLLRDWQENVQLSILLTFNCL